MIHHSDVSLDYLQSLLDKNKSAYIGEPREKPLYPGGPRFLYYALSGQRLSVALWRSKGHTYAPPCDNVRPDGRCAGHEKEN